MCSSPQRPASTGRDVRANPLRERNTVAASEEPRTSQDWRAEFEAAKRVNTVRVQDEQAARIIVLERRCDLLHERYLEAFQLADSHKVTIGQLQTELDAARESIERIRNWLRKKFPDEAGSEPSGETDISTQDT